MVSSGGLEIVAAGATDSGAVINANGFQQVWAGGVGSGAQINSAGVEQVWGTAIATTVSSGGYEQVFSGGIVSGATISGGELELASGGTAGSSTVTFAGGGILKLDQSTAFTGLVAGFAIPDQLDLADIAFGSGTTLGFVEAGNNTSGTLTVSDGTHTANILLLGQYAAGNFHLATDGHGGTLVTDPPLAVATDQNPIALAATHHA
jgi:autotransporter passenger strand-loop-strand repeat protein